MKKYLPFLAFLLLGLFLGWIFFGGNDADSHADHDHIATEVDGKTVWTCSMDPQVRMSEPGDCPICGMDLILLSSMIGSNLNPGELLLSEAALRLSEIQTSVVTTAAATRNLRLTGKVRPDETRISVATARFPGRIEALHVNFTGQAVKKGQSLASVYSPELLAAQRELVQTVGFQSTSPQLYQAARRKLQLWGLSETQIDLLARDDSGAVKFEIVAPRTGTVTQRLVAVGDYVQEGMPMFEVMDLGQLWIELDVYEADLAWIRMGAPVDISIAALPGDTFRGKVSFISPIIDPQTRVAVARIPLTNAGQRLKPGMFVTAQLEATLPSLANALLIPRSAVLWTGDRAVVYVKQPNRSESVFMMREITLGSEAGAFYVVKEGLREGEELVTQGTFKVDAAAQIAGKRSMMNDPMSDAKAVALEGNIPPAFRQQVEAVVDRYLQLTEALVESDASKATVAAKAGLQALANVELSGLSAPLLGAWKAEASTIESGLRTISINASLEDQRKTLATLSLAMYHSLRQIGSQAQPYYYQYCPMADGDKGAFWLSKEPEIRNPYFGASMLKCGETRDVIQ